MPEEPRSYSPTTPEANRNAQQGGGAGQRDMEAVQDPNRPEGADQYDFDGDDRPEEDGGEPSYGAQQGQTHTRWPDKTEAERGQGPKTRARNKEIVNGRLA
jgi:hypothetical protein